MTEDPSKSGYLRSVRRQKIIAVGMVALAFVFLFLLFGVCKNDRVTLQDGFDVLITHLEGNVYPVRLKEYIFWETLFPRALSAIFVGGTLGIAGAAMQHIMRNPLADPYTTGISSGAGLGATLFLVLGMSVIPGLAGQAALVTNAFLLSLIPKNILTGADLATEVTAGKVDGKTPYVLGIAGEPAALGFYKFTGDHIPGGKAYYLATE